jgi:hypothetical protein
MTEIADVVLQIGQEMHVQVYNDSGGQIDNGEAVYISGVNGSGLPTIAKAQSNDPATSVVLGIATEDIINGEAGFITSFGLVRDLNTASFGAGVTLYLDPDTPGALTDTIPDSPNFTVIVGTVIVSDGSAGIVLVDVTQAAIISGTTQSKVYTLPLRGVLGAAFNITGELRTVAAGETGDYATDFAVNNNHAFLLVNSLTGSGTVTITGTSLSESTGVPVASDTETITVDTGAGQYYQSTKKWWEITNIDIPAGISAINYDVGVVGYADFGNTDFKLVGYRIDAPAAGINAEIRLRIIKINDDGSGKASVSDLEDITLDASSGTDQVVDNLRSGGNDRTYNPTVATLWANGSVAVLKQGDFDTYFTSDENVFESSSKDEGFILRIEDANNVEFVTLRIDYQLLG